MDTTLNLLTAHAAGRKALREELPYATLRTAKSCALGVCSLGCMLLGVWDMG